MRAEALEAVERRARRAYEKGRLRRALASVWPLALVVVVALAASRSPSSTLAFGGLLVALGAIYRWRGQTLGRAVLPGVLAGLVPLVAALAAMRIGHLCTGAGCVSFCIPACITGGVVAGFWLGRLARRQSAPGLALFGGGSLALVTGAMGCCCVGLGGTLGLAAGFILTAAPVFLLAAARPLT